MSIDVFYIEDMTSLRYAVPFIKAAKKLINKDVVLVQNSSMNVHKYNSIRKYQEKLENICQENEVNFIEASNLLEKKDVVRNLFCIENVSKQISCKNYYSFQHGFDWTGLHKDNLAATYIVTEEHFKVEIEKLGLKAIVSPHPVVFWDWSFYVERYKTFLKEKPSATMFYPEEGYRDTFKRVHERLLSLGYDIYIKQRKKNQSVPGDFENFFYDDVWYPTESIALPLITDFSVGFGTSAYTDLIHINRNFIDLCMPDYSKKYYKPIKDNMITIMDNFVENFCSLSLKNVNLAEKIIDPCDQEKIKNFLYQVIT